ncbi:MAG: ATP-dependent Clp protease proteolytic subunit [Phycisphaerales bacterium]|jgi:hypothetical protein|nr:ATP-dependent Clp protease proteolytic subunit [Phycisphaerales bacterium]
MRGAAANAANEVIEQSLQDAARRVEKVFGADFLAFVGPIDVGVDDVVRDAIEQIDRRNPARRLAVLVETEGGYIETVQRIVETLRHFYSHVEFIVPNYAMSAGTVLVLSGDAIYMDYYSILGPIDPQVRRKDQFVPALGYLEQYKRLIQKSRENTLTDAELSFLLEKFDPAELYRYEHARDLSVSLLKEWLAKYKFKDWCVTETNRTAVTDQMRLLRAEEIATALNDVERWHSHARGIGMEALRTGLNLKIEDLEQDKKRAESIATFYHLFMDYSAKQGVVGAVYVTDKSGYRVFSQRSG